MRNTSEDPNSSSQKSSYFLSLLRLFTSLSSPVYYSEARLSEMSRKVAVVTGGNKGIGLEVVRGLCEKFDGDVFLTSRDTKRGETAVDELKKAGLNPMFHQLDVTDQKSLDTFKKFLEEKYGGLDVLVNNAGIKVENVAEKFGKAAEETIKTNFTGVLNTSRTLFPLLRPHARVVNFSSYYGHLLQVPGTDLRKEIGSKTLTENQLEALMQKFVSLAKDGKHTGVGWPSDAYTVSKVGVAALSFIQQRKLDADKKEDIIVNAVHPGYCKTDMTNMKGQLTAKEGAQAPLYCALLPPNTKSPRGNFVWWNKKIIDWEKELPSE